MVFDLWPACHAWQLGKITKRSASKLQRCSVLRCLDVLCVCEEFHPSNGWFGTICVVHVDFKRFTLFLISCFCLHLFWGFAICLLVFLAEGEGEEEGYGNLACLLRCFAFPRMESGILGSIRKGTCLCVWHF